MMLGSDTSRSPQIGMAERAFYAKFEVVSFERGGSMSGLDIRIELPFDLIQVLRLAHALAEAGCRLHVSAKDARKLSQLRKIFGLQFEIGGEGVPTLHGLAIDHTEPEVRVGDIARPLIFPVAAFEYCRSRWPEKRLVRASFSGLPTAIRKRALNEWLKLSKLGIRVPEHVRERPPDDFLRRVSRKIGRRLGIPRRPHRYPEIYSGGVKLILSDEGRVFPRKAWNVDYYSSLLESEFTLCPDGEEVGGSSWTYRFFEGLLCGTIPVVEHSCAAYEGFKFRRMEEPLSELKWSRDEAEHNFELAMKRLTVAREDLRSEVVRLLANPDAVPADEVTMRRVGDWRSP